MTVKKRGLGKGLDALLSHSNAASRKSDIQQPENTNDNELIHLDLDLLQPGKYQPRKDMSPEALEELAESIKKHIPEFTISYKPDFRQKIADSWPSSIDDSRAREDWNWEHSYSLDDITKEMLTNLKAKTKQPV